jgi:hypothetical protein
MNPALPVCRYVLACLDGRVTAPGERIVAQDAAGAEVELVPATGGQIVLLNPVITLWPEPRGRYPSMYDRLFLFAQLTNGHGRHGLAVELLRWHQGQTFQMFRTPETPHDFGTDRAAAHIYRVRLNTVWFPTAGQYSFLVLCDGTEIGRAEVELLEQP